MAAKQKQSNEQKISDPIRGEFDNLLKRMLATPPKPHAKPEKKKTGK